MSWAEHERAALAATLREIDPASPTLCEGWSAHRLLAHLVLREHRPDLMVRDAGAPAGAEPQLTRLIDGPRAPSYEALIDRFTAGPPRWSPFSWAPDATDLVEYVVHHEDLRRAGEPRPPRRLPAAMEAALWERLILMARLVHRSSPVGVVLVVPSGPRRVVRRRRDAVAVIGAPVELALHTLGRGSVARVEVRGRPETVARFEAGRE